jgi:hypothetical protein
MEISKKRKLEFDEKNKEKEIIVKKLKVDEFALIQIGDIVDYKNELSSRREFHINSNSELKFYVYNVTVELFAKLYFKCFAKPLITFDGNETKTKPYEFIFFELHNCVSTINYKCPDDDRPMIFQVLEKETNRVITSQSFKSRNNELKKNLSLLFLLKNFNNKRLWINKQPVSNALESMVYKMSGDLIVDDLEMFHSSSQTLHINTTEKESENSDVYKVILESFTTFFESDEKIIPLETVLKLADMDPKAERYFESCSPNVWKLKSFYKDNNKFFKSGLKVKRDFTVCFTTCPFYLNIKGQEICTSVDIEGLGPDVNQLVIDYWNPTYSITELLPQKKERNLYIANQIGFTSSNLPYIDLHTRFDNTKPLKIIALDEGRQVIFVKKQDNTFISVIIGSSSKTTIQTLQEIILCELRRVYNLKLFLLNGVEMDDPKKYLSDYNLVHGSVILINS